MSEMTLKPNEKLDVRNILKDLDKYEPKRRGWTWRKPAPNLEMGPFTYHDVSEPLKQSVGLPPAKYFGDIDPQPLPVITTEIASGRFEDDIRRMRMAAWHGADHIMVIRHMGQSHIDGLMEGTPQGIGGVPITRKQVRAQRKALDLIEEEVGPPHQLSLLCLRCSWPRCGRHVCRGRHQWRPPGSPVQRPLPRHQLRALLRGRLRVQVHYGLGRDAAD